MNKRLNFLIAGCGNMATALLDSSLSERFDLFLYNPTRIKAEALQRVIGGEVVDSLDSLSKIDILFLGFKPQQFSSAVLDYKNVLEENALIFSVLAGIELQKIESSLNSNRVFRMMPNTPSKIGEGVITYYCSSQIEQNDLELFNSLFDNKASLFQMENDLQIDQSTPVTGSAPAFIFEFALQMQRYLEGCGFSKRKSKQMVVKTFSGASALMSESELSLMELMTQVTSRGGVTERGLKVLSNGRFDHLVQECLNESFKKNSELKG